jgi:hypothetical protein
MTILPHMRFGLTLPQVAKGLGKRLGERGVVSLHPDIYPRKYYRLIKEPNGTILSVDAKEALWREGKRQFDLGDFGAGTEWLISRLITLTKEAIETGDRAHLQEFLTGLLAADANQMPAGSARIQAGVLYRRALTKQVRLDYMPSTAAVPIDRDREPESIIADEESALSLLDQDHEPGQDDCKVRVLTALVSVIHRHRRAKLGYERYAQLLTEKQVIERLWTSLLKMRRGHPRAEVTASNLTNLCSLFARDDTRKAYVYLVAIDGRYLDLNYKAGTAFYSLRDDPDCAHLRNILTSNPVTSEEIRECSRSLS